MPSAIFDMLVGSVATILFASLSYLLYKEKKKNNT